MNKTIEQLSETKLVGITAHTSNLREMNPETAKIGVTMQKFFGSGIQEQILRRKNPSTVFAVYTNYESNEYGQYNYFLGEEVNDFENIQQGFETLTISAQTYIKFTSDPGKTPAVRIDMWQNIWKMKAADLGDERAYIASQKEY